MSRGGLEWAAILERLERTRQLSDGEDASAAERRGILQRRADRLALPVQDNEDSQDEDTVIVFRAEPDRFAFPLSELLEVIPEPKLAAVPRAPAEVAGLIQLRGEIRPVYHLRRLLELEHEDSARPALVLLLRTANGDFGIGADAVEDIRKTPIRVKSPASVARGSTRWTTEDLIPVLTAESLLKKEE